MAETYVILLRGVNVGRANRVAMADLRALLSALGYRDVRTLLNSGNAIVSAGDTSAAEVAARVCAALESQLGVRAPVLAVSASDLAAIVAENPLGAIATDPSRLLVAFVGDPSALARATSLSEREWAPESLAIGSRAAYLWSPLGVSESKAFPVLGDALQTTVTTRNWTTVLKLAALADEPV